MSKIVIPYRPRYPQTEIHSNLESHRFSVLVAHRRMGKTVLAVNHLIKSALTTRKERAVFGYVAPFRNQAEQIAWGYLQHYTGVIPGVAYNQQKLSVTLPNGAMIRIFGADNPDALRGMYFDGVVMDEVAQMKPDVWQEIVRPALADRGGWAVFIGTPKGVNLFQELYELARREQAMGNPDWCAMLYRADQTGAINDSELAALKKEMSENAFAQEFLCDFSASSDDILIPFDLVHECVGRTMQNDMFQRSPVVMGVDVARFGDDRSVIVVRQGLMVLEISRHRQMDLMTFAGIVAQKAVETNAEAVFVDGVGVGAGVVDRLRQLGLDVIDAQAGTKPTDPTRYFNKRAEMWAAMKEWMQSGASLPDEQELIADLTGLTYHFAPGGQLQLEKKEDMKKRGLPSPDMADALALTFYMPIFRHRELPGTRNEGFGAGYTPWSVDADSGYSWEPFGGNNPYDERVRF